MKVMKINTDRYHYTKVRKIRDNVVVSVRFKEKQYRIIVDVIEKLGYMSISDFIRQATLEKVKRDLELYYKIKKLGDSRGFNFNI